VTSLRGANLAGADLRETLVEPCDLTGADLTGARADGLTLAQCRLEGTKLDGVILEDLYWQPLLDQIQILWRGAAAWNAFRAQETHANMQRPAIFSGVDFSGHDFGNANLEGMVFVASRFDRATLGGCRLYDTSFRSGSLVGARFDGVVAFGTRFNEAILRDAAFDRATLEHCTFTRADASGASFADATVLRGEWDRLRAPETCFDRATLTKTLLMDADLGGSSFRDARLISVYLKGANLAGCRLDEAVVVEPP
jgi:uncharacterized protein YjbI with pentapeptide repeats